MIVVNQLHPLFFGEIVGADLTAEPSEDLRNTVQDAMDRHAVCVVRQGPITDEQHIRFARLFGPLELPPGYGTRPAGRMAPELFFAGNLDLEGNIKPLTPANQNVAKGAERFHADSSFNPLPSKWSMLRGVECPPPEVGGDTLFVDLRAAYDDLPPEMKARVEGMTGIHDFWLGRKYAGLEVTEEMRAAMPMPPVHHPLVREAPLGRKALFVGGHCVGVVGMDPEEGHRFVEELYDHVTQPRYVHRHHWRLGDIVIWDNRFALHAATPLETDKYRRDMRRATINESGEEIDAYEYRRRQESAQA
ncbi:alpha-ketoglutarate-dependent 2,4-dichlorophenoxyacetate dioxygenase [Sphingobium sp. SYK-6]|uniref:TauD/TfdA dioxygenase family protein n=1 Tax=Sphingobium sp. (strain NBRC 103272 / SYK-6) TaxID=627192 RepID=UPI0002276A3A|nr:TauD/TfdA family dioxygenase [Sphingobium sp. SYK-6]BAK65400.1 alpha-ketoglutarate-dependent 2,4-dichlorophenoxyacetate dioxygenase [Sphingobium sp. SYK-6]